MPKKTPKRQKKKTVETTSVKVSENITFPPEIETPKEKPQKTRGGVSQYPNKVKPYLQDIARYIRCGVTEGQLCEYYGVSKTQWWTYKEKYPELNETLSKAKQEFKTALINKAYELAVGGHYIDIKKTTYYDKHGQPKESKIEEINHDVKPDAGMLQFLLINRFPSEFARDPQMVELRKKALELAEQGKLPPNGGEGL